MVKGNLVRNLSMVWALLLGCMAFSAHAISQLQASVDKNPVLANESFVLEIVANDDVNRNAIDTSVLLKDFVVGQTRVSSSTQSINFKTTRTTTWTTVLIARTPGTYVIPAFEVDGVRSKPIRLSVMAQQDGAEEQRDVFIKSKLYPERVYPGQTAVLETQLFLGLQLERGTLTDPESDQMSFAQMGDDSDKVDIVNGRRYQVITRRYAVTADQVGEHQIRPPMFSGTVITSTRRSFFDSNRTRPLQVLDEDLTLRIMPIPKEAPSPFIPAEYITLEEQSELPSQITVGEPVTRTIALTANGVGEALLPAIPHKYSDKINVYPDKVDLSTSYQGKSTIAQRIETAALIATLPGQLTLPEIRIAYWDTRYHQTAEAVLPARTIEVLPAANAPEEPEPVQQVPAPAPTGISLIWLGATLGFALLWLLTLLAWWLHVRKLKKALSTGPDKGLKRSPQASPSSWKALNEAINNYPNGDLTRPLARWLLEKFDVDSLQALPASAEAQQALEALQALQGAKFGQRSEKASPKALQSALEVLNRKAHGDKQTKAQFRLYS